MSDFGTAVVFGKFWPLHVGHLSLISEAVARSDTVIVVVDDGTEDVPTEIRMSWVAHEFPTVEVGAAPDLCGHDTFECTQICSERYAAWLSGHHGHVDAVFSAESYGALLATCLGATSIQLERPDPELAGRRIRRDLPGHWHLLSKAARGWYCRRIVVVGAESTGTTTLASDLAQRLKTVWVPEYGRRFTEDHGIGHLWQSRDFDLIAQRQAEMEDEAAKRSGPVLVCDTDVLATAIWHERYLGERSSSVESMAEHRRPHMYVLTDDEIPFVQDGIRDGEHLRGWMTERFREELHETGVPWTEVWGTRQQRVVQTLRAMVEQLGEMWVQPSLTTKS
jgi:HTH-type transcriptional regulator, transcriptional repressor of NAD biosynthesis genes